MVARVLTELAEAYPAWWVDLLGEHNHVGGAEATRWLLARARLRPGDAMLDCGAFVGAAARMAALKAGARSVAVDLGLDFLRAGRALPGGAEVAWVGADNRRLPFADGAFASVWALDTTVAPGELTRVAASRATLCLDAEAPTDARGGMESFLEEWEALGWRLADSRNVTLEATQAWRRAEARMVHYRPVYERRYGTRGYVAQLDLLADLVKGYERGGRGHALLVLDRDR